VCGSAFEDAVVYLCAGACADLDKSKIVGQEAHWICHIHTSETEMRGCVSVPIVELMDSDQFDLLFCSVECLESFFVAIVTELRQQVILEKKGQSAKEGRLKTRKAPNPAGKRKSRVRSKATPASRKGAL